MTALRLLPNMSLGARLDELQRVALELFGKESVEISAATERQWADCDEPQHPEKIEVKVSIDIAKEFPALEGAHLVRHSSAPVDDPTPTHAGERAPSSSSMPRARVMNERSGAEPPESSVGLGPALGVCDSTGAGPASLVFDRQRVVAAAEEWSKDWTGRPGDHATVEERDLWDAVQALRTARAAARTNTAQRDAEVEAAPAPQGQDVASVIVTAPPGESASSQPGTSSPPAFARETPRGPGRFARKGGPFDPALASPPPETRTDVDDDDEEDECEEKGLLPCPFCGSVADYGEATDGVNDGGMFVVCQNRECMASTNLVFPLMDDVLGLLAEKWNARVPPAQPPQRATGLPARFSVEEEEGAGQVRFVRDREGPWMRAKDVSEHVARVERSKGEWFAALHRAWCETVGLTECWKSDPSHDSQRIIDGFAILKAECERLRAEVKTERAEKNTREHEHWQVMKRVMDAISAELKALGHPESGGKIEDLAIAGMRAEKARADAAERKLASGLGTLETGVTLSQDAQNRARRVDAEHPTAAPRAPAEGIEKAQAPSDALLECEDAIMDRIFDDSLSKVRASEIRRILEKSWPSPATPGPIVMPERRREGMLISPADRAHAWNECLDEVARLNPGRATVRAVRAVTEDDIARVRQWSGPGSTARAAAELNQRLGFGLAQAEGAKAGSPA